MVEIPERLECLFTASPDQDASSYSIEIPEEELDTGTISVDETYRVVILETHQSQETTNTDMDTESQEVTSSHPGPPVSKGDVREVTIESLGDQGDGIAKVERGYVVIVPHGQPDDEVTVEIQNVRENVAFARILAQDDTDEAAF